MNLPNREQTYLVITAVTLFTLALSSWAYDSYAHAAEREVYNNSTSSRAIKIQRPSELYIPSGYDDSDQITILAGGDYDMTCEQMGSYKVEVDEQKKVVRLITSKIQHAPEHECAGNYEIYYKEYHLGSLEEGIYPVVAEGENDLVGKLVVSNSKSSLFKKFKYPLIKDVRLSTKPDGSATLNIDARLDNNCQSIEDVFVKRSSENFWEVYPKITQKNFKNCTKGNFVFTKAVPLGNIKKETHIFYIRSANENTIFHIEALI